MSIYAGSQSRIRPVLLCDVGRHRHFNIMLQRRSNNEQTNRSALRKFTAFFKCCHFLFLLALQPPVGQGFLIHDVSI